MRIFAAILMLVSSLAAAHAFGLGEGNRFGRLGTFSKKSTGGGLTPCTSTGIFNLSNVCNDIYFIGALK